MDEYNKRVEKLKELIDDADYILIGAGAGLSTAAGVEYAGKRFTDNFQNLLKSMDSKICTLQCSIHSKVQRKDGHILQSTFM